VGAATGKPVRVAICRSEAREAPGIERHKGGGGERRALIEGVAIDITRLRGGAGLRALGEGSVCEWCDVRGLCRRDDWQAGVQGLADAAGEDGR
jgi:hypothetical protein